MKSCLIWWTPYRCCSVFRLWLRGAQSRNQSAKNADFSRWQHPLCVTPKPTPDVLLRGSRAAKKPQLAVAAEDPQFHIPAVMAAGSYTWFQDRNEPSLPLSLPEVFLLGRFGLFERGVLRFCPRSITHFCGAVLAAALSQPRKAPKNGSSACLTGPAILHLCLAKGIVWFAAMIITVVYQPIQERLILEMKKKKYSFRDMWSGSHKPLQQCLPSPKNAFMKLQFCPFLWLLGNIN